MGAILARLFGAVTGVSPKTIAIGLAVIATVIGGGILVHEGIAAFDHALANAEAVGTLKAQKVVLEKVANDNANQNAKLAAGQEIILASLNALHAKESAGDAAYQAIQQRVAAAPATKACASAPAIRAAMGWPDVPVKAPKP
jgi:hypothetical protein